MSKKRLCFLGFWAVDNYRYLRFLFYVARAVALATDPPRWILNRSQSPLIYGRPIGQI